MNSYNFFAPTRVLFGAGQLGNLHTLPMPGKKALLVTSNGKSAIRNGSLAKVQDELKKAGCEHVWFNKVASNPLKENVEEGAQVARENGCDFLVALGGGSVIDATKSMAMFTPQDSNDLWEYVNSKSGKAKAPEKPVLPWIAIPTSAGTGSEVDPIGAITNPETNEKLGVGGCPGIMARYAIVDPKLTATMPPKLTAYQGFDALFHSIEGYLSKRHNPMSEMVQRTAIEKIGKYLARAVQNGSDMEARSGVMFASTLSGYSLTMCGCISQHSLEQAVNAFHPQMPHGADLIMLSYAYFKFWVDKHIIDERFIDLAKFLGKTDATKAEDFLDALLTLQKACGVDTLKLSDFGVQKDEAQKFADYAHTYMSARFQNDPAPTTVEEITGIFEQAWK